MMIAVGVLNVGCAAPSEWEEISLDNKAEKSSSIAPPETPVVGPTITFGPSGMGSLPGATASTPSGNVRPPGWNGTWGMREFIRHVTRYYWATNISDGELDSMEAAGGTCRSIASGIMRSGRNPYRYPATQDESFNAARTYLTVSYRALYQREPDSAGFNQWFNYGKNVAENAEDGNAGITAVENGMLNSAEFRSVCLKSGLTF